jgi:hypothetical protein
MCSGEGRGWLSRRGQLIEMAVWGNTMVARRERGFFAAMTTTAPTSAVSATGTMVVFGAEKTPPKARLVFRVGAVGRRWNRMKDADPKRLAEVTGKLLEEIREQVSAYRREFLGMGRENPYTDELPVMRVISSIAEGGDRVIAGEAMKKGYELQCPLPFDKGEYAKDFENAESLAAYRGFLSGNPQCFEVDGNRQRVDAAYVAAGRIVMNQSDLLIAIWDGEQDVSEAGTYHRIYEAVQYRIPVIWIHTSAPHEARLLRDPDSLPDTSGAIGKSEAMPLENISEILRPVIGRLIAPPGFEKEGAGEDKDQEEGEESAEEEAREVQREEYFNEQRPKYNWWFWWKWFRDIAAWGKGSGLKGQGICVGDFEEAVKEDWPGGEGKEGEIDEWINPQLRVHYAWSDKLADINADRYRSSFLMIYLLGAAAVFMALFPRAMGWEDGYHFGLEVACSAIEILAIGLIVLLVLENSKGKWQERWMNYRLTAELIRQLRFLAPLGGPKPMFRVTTRELIRNYVDPAETWMLWHVRAIARQVGLRNVKVTPDKLVEYIDFLQKRLTAGAKGQEAFHDKTEMRSKRIDERLHWAGVVFFMLTVLAIIAHPALIFSMEGRSETVDGINGIGVLLLMSAFLPALASALAAIRNQGEFPKLRWRSEAMKKSFRSLNRKLDAMKKNKAELTFTKVRELAGDLGELMVDESLDWRVVFKDRIVEFG